MWQDKVNRWQRKHKCEALPSINLTTLTIGLHCFHPLILIHYCPQLEARGFSRLFRPAELVEVNKQLDMFLREHKCSPGVWDQAAVELGARWLMGATARCSTCYLLSVRVDGPKVSGSAARNQDTVGQLHICAPQIAALPPRCMATPPAVGMDMSNDTQLESPRFVPLL